MDEILKLASAIGPVGVFALALWWIWNTSRANKRVAAEEVPQDRLASYGHVRILAEMLERHDVHLKENTDVAKDTAFSVERLAAVFEQHAQVQRDELREIRESQRRTENAIDNLRNHR